MASISNTIEIQDRFSGALNRLNDGLQTAIDRFTQLNNIMNSSGSSLNLNNGVARLDSGLRDTVSNVNNINNTLNNTNNILNATNHNVQNINNSYGDTNNTIVNIINGQTRLNNSISQGNNNANGLLGTIKKVAATYLGISAVKGILNQSDQLSQITARLNLMNDNLQTTDELQKLIFQSAQNSRASFIDTASAISKMGLNAKNAFSSNAELIAFMEQINKQFAIGGAGAQEQKNAMIQLTQAMAAGTLRGEELNSILDQAPGIARAIEKNMGWAEGSIKSYAQEGKVTAQIVKESMLNMADETNAAFDSMPKTFSQVWTDISNRAQAAFQPVLERLNDLANSEQIVQLGNAIINVLAMVSMALIDVSNGVLNVYSFFANNWGIIGPIVYGIVAALTAYLTVMGLVNLANIVSTISAGMASLAADIYAASLAMQAGATFTATVAQYGLNAALLACPITWIIIAIIAIIAAIYVVIGIINKVKGTTYSATGFIAGCFTALGAAIYNLIAYLWNAFAAFAEFIANVFNHPVYSIKALFVNLADSVLGCLEGMTSGFDSFATNLANAVISAVNIAIRALNWFIEAANNLPGLNLSTIGEFGSVASITSSIQSARSSLQDWLGDNKPDNYWTAPKMDYMNVGGAFQWGFDKGYALQDSVTGAFDDLFNTDPYDYSGMYNDMLDNLGNIADNTGNLGDIGKDTGKIKDSLDITEEDLKYMRDLAETEAINRFTTAEIKVQMTNHNTVNSDMDLDGIIDNLGSRLEDSLFEVAEGATYDV